jgi:alpha-beta hydrolase superfamily lysophospholipase
MSDAGVSDFPSDYTPHVAPDREETLVAADGTKIHVAHFAPRTTPRFVLVALHGFAVHSGRYGHFWAKLAEAGCAVTTFDCRGHGRSDGRRGYVKRFADFHDDLGLVIATARQNAPSPTLPLVVLGHSHGGLIALDAVLSGRVAPAGLVLAAPWLGLFMKPAAWKSAMSGIMSRIWPTLALDNELKAEDGTRNPKIIASFRQDPNNHHVAAARWYTEVLAAHARIRQNGAQLAVPTLLLSAGQDRIVANSALDALAAAAPRFVQAKRYEALYHELLLEPEWPQVLADVTQFLSSISAQDARTAAASSAVPAILHPTP